ncbi:MAG TPA: extracellular solute-binding protein, partial [Thermomicrobiales bacterium]|nr:extracellular solute-binding protein [Thermomicrobiales bacterium]
IHTYGEIQHEYVTKQYLDDFIYGRNDVSFVIPENQDSAGRLQDWVKAGYFTPDFSGIGYDDSWQAYEGGKGVYMITGSWISGEMKAGGADGKFGFFLMPPLAADKPNLHVAGTGMAYAIRKSSSQQELAAEYINFLVSPESADVLATTGIIPLAVDPAKVEPGTLYADIVAAWQHILTTDTAGHYLDWASPTFYDTIVASLTDLMGLNITPEEFVQQLQDDYGAFIAKQDAS